MSSSSRRRSGRVTVLACCSCDMLVSFPGVPARQPAPVCTLLAISVGKRVMLTYVLCRQHTRSSEHMSTERPISRLPVPEEATLPDDIRALFDQMRVKPGFVPNVYRALSAHPQQLRGFVALYQAIMEQDAGLSKAEREMIAVVVSAANH